MHEQVLPPEDPLMQGDAVRLLSVWGHSKLDRPPDAVIGGEADPYLLRWFLVPRNPVFNIYRHRMLRDDDDRALHDHPWPSVSVMLSGLLREITSGGDRLVAHGDVIFRPAEFAHRLEVVEGPAETLFITGPKVRKWGFHCPQGWRPWEEFVHPDDPGSIGPGCG